MNLRFFYTFVLFILLPYAALRILWREPGTRCHWRRVFERLGWPSRGGLADRPVCLHAVSVGEVLATQPLVQFLQQQYPHCAVLLTTGTPGGKQIAMQAYAERVPHHYLPYDLPLFVERFLDTFRPRLMLIMETEIWPNLYAECKRRGIPVLLLNARLSARSAARYRYLASFTRSVLQRIDFVMAQSEADAQRFQDLGLPARCLAISPNLKYGAPTMVPEAAAKTQLQQAMAGRMAWVAGSTHPGEEAAVLRVHRLLRQSYPELLLILAPRHVQRAREIQTLCRSHDFSVACGQQEILSAARPAVWVLDILGTLQYHYPLAQVAFVGGSLMPALGGHNVLEPLACGVATVTGPHTRNFASMVRDLLSINALIQVRDEAELGARVHTLLAEQTWRARLVSQGQAFIARQRDGLHPVTRLIAHYLENSLSHDET